LFEGRRLTVAGERRHRLALRLTLLLLAVITVGLAVMGLYVTRVLERHAVEQLEAGLVTSARLVEDGLRAVGTTGGADLEAELHALAERYATIAATRVTVMAPDGTVLADSARDPETMENHAQRPEVRTALAGGVGSDVRRSRTLDVEMLYVAVPLNSPGRPPGVLRLAVPLTEVVKARAAVRRTVELGAVLAIAVALGIGLFLTRRVTRPVSRMRATAQRMAAGDLDHRVPVHGRDEVAELGHALNRMADALREKVQALESQRAEITAILERMVEGVIALDQRSRIVVMNPAARLILGLPTRPDAGGGPSGAGRPLADVVREKALFDLVDACRAGAPPDECRREIELPPPVDRILHVDAVAVPFPHQGPGTLLVLHDITELRRLERVRAEFVANVSHELRTPLTAIKGYLETLLDGALEEAHARPFLETAHTHAERLGRLVDDLLQLSDVETGKIVLEVRPVLLRETAGAVAAMFEGQAAPKQLRLVNTVPTGLHAEADPDRVAQILVNLVDNAVKYTPAGGQITLSAARAADAVEISVRDTGIGIPSTDLPRITERFYRVDKARSRALGGTGLGLAIVKHLVQVHGGELRIESELGKGTIVRFTLPAVPDRAAS
jgi:two-component system phosphate regulon sensor histidine kinase PhoR